MLPRSVPNLEIPGLLTVIVYAKLSTAVLTVCYINLSACIVHVQVRKIAQTATLLGECMLLNWLQAIFTWLQFIFTTLLYIEENEVSVSLDPFQSYCVSVSMFISGTGDTLFNSYLAQSTAQHLWHCTTMNYSHSCDDVLKGSLKRGLHERNCSVWSFSQTPKGLRWWIIPPRGGVKAGDRFLDEPLHSVAQGHVRTSVSPGFIKGSLFVSRQVISHFLAVPVQCYATHTHLMALCVESR